MSTSKKGSESELPNLALRPSFLFRFRSTRERQVGRDYIPNGFKYDSQKGRGGAARPYTQKGSGPAACVVDLTCINQLENEDFWLGKSLIRGSNRINVDSVENQPNMARR